ncbi:YfiR family protein [Desulfobacterota bacterium M19]
MKMRPLLKMAVIVLALIASFSAVSPAGASGGREPVIRQVQIKAVYLYNFLHFISWPDRRKEQVVKVIGVLGDEEMGRSLTELARRLRQRGRTAIRVILYDSYRPGLDFSACRILFIGRSQADNFKIILSRLKGQPILTVADTRNFLGVGGMIKLVEMGRRIRYQVNLTAARAAGLRLSSQLLESALTVIRPGVKED